MFLDGVLGDIECLRDLSVRAFYLGDNLYVRGYSGTPPVAVTGAGYTLLDRQFLKGFVRLDVVPVGDLGEVVAPLIGVDGSSPIAPTN
jgi:hypothetical protein